jgi:hypothetical protein
MQPTSDIDEGQCPLWVPSSGGLLECAPGARQEVSDLTGCAGLSKDESHGQTAFAQHRVQAAGRAGVYCRRDALRAGIVRVAAIAAVVAMA